MKLAGKIFAIVLGSLILLTGALQIVVNMPFVSRKLVEIASEYIDGDIRFAKLNISLIKSFPDIRVSIDSLSLTYPHDRFAAYEGTSVSDPLTGAGRGEAADTLLRFDRLTAAVNPWKLISGKVCVNEADLEGAAVYAHRYDTAANWDIFKSEAEPEEEPAPSSSLPQIRVRNLRIDGNPRMVYTDDVGKVYASLDFKSFFLEGDLKIDADSGEILYDNVALDLDSLRLLAKMAPDDYDISLDRLSVSNPDRQVLDIDLKADAKAFIKSLGRLESPLALDARVGFESRKSVTKFDIRNLKADVAYVPLEASGFVHLLRDSVKLKMRADVKDCNLGKVVMKYGPLFVDMLKGMPVSGRLDAGVDAEGYLAANVKPAVNASVALDAAVPGVSLAVNARSRDFLGRDPFFDVHTKCLAVLDSISRFVPSEAGVDFSGDMDLKLDAKARKSELNTYKFKEADISGLLLSKHLRFDMPADTLGAVAHNTAISLKSNRDGLDIGADFDSLFFNNGVDFRARAREMKNRLRMYKVEENGQFIPRADFVTNDRSLFVKAADNRVGLMGVDVSAAVQKRVRPQRRAHPDSLSHRGRGRGRGGYEDDELASGDIDFGLDSTLLAYFRQWEPYGNISAKRGFFSSPAIPLRTRLSAFEGNFTGNEIKIDTVHIQMGTSDVSARGYVSNVRRAIRKRGAVKADLSLISDRLNINELLVAMEKGRELSDVNPDSESEGSFVVDSIACADITAEKMALIIVPRNVDASLAVKAGRVDYSDLLVSPFSANLRMKDRTLQLTDASALTNLGGVNLDAFYSTKSKTDISAGIGMKMRDVSAYGIIHLLPTVDDLMPALKSFEGNFDLDLSATTQIDTNMNLVIPSLDGILRISGRDLNISDAGDLKRITRLLLFRNKNIGRIEDLSVDAVVHDSKLEVFPFELFVDRYKLALRGMQGLDGRMNYHVSVMKSPFLIPFGVNIFGYTDNWRFSLGLAKYREGRVPAYSEQLGNMQVNILKSIKDVYRKGVKNALEQAEYTPEAKDADLSPEQEVDASSLAQLDGLNYEMAAALAEEELNAEIEEALSENVIDLGKLVEEYEAGNSNKIIERRIEKLKRQL